MVLTLEAKERPTPCRLPGHLDPGRAAKPRSTWQLRKTLLAFARLMAKAAPSTVRSKPNLKAGGVVGPGRSFWLARMVANGLGLRGGVGEQVGEGEAVAVDDFASRHWGGCAEHGAGAGEGVELSVFAAGIYLGREGG